MKNIITFKEWAIPFINLLETRDTLAQLMYCIVSKKNNIVLCDVSTIPNCYKVEDVVNLIEGNYLKI